MPTMIDSLFVALKLDPSEFKKGQKEASAALAKTKDETRKAATEIESAGKSAGEAIEGLSRRFIALFALLAGARSVKDFTAQIVGADSAIGRLAANLGTTPDRLDAMTSAVERNGGSAGAAASSFRSLSDSFEELKNTGNTGILVMLQRLQGQGGATIDMMHGFDKALPGIVNNLTALKAKGDAVGANWFGRQLGIDEETVNFLQQGWPKVQAEIEKSKRLGVVSPESAAAAQKMMQSWMSLQQAARDLGRTILTDLSPPIQRAMDGMTAWVEANKGWLNQKIGDAIRAVGSAIDAVANSPEFRSLVRDVSSRETWRPFLDFIKQAGSEENWKDLKSLIGWFRGQLKEIKDLIKFLSIITSSGFRNGVPMEQLSREYDEAHGYGGRSRVSGGRGLPPLAEGPAHVFESEGGGAGGLRDKARRRQRAKESHPRPGRGDPTAPYTPTSFTEGTGISQKDYDAFREGLTDIEGKRYNRMGGAGGRYAGRYQMGPAEITDTARRLGVARPSNEEFLSNPQMQEKFFENYTLDHYKSLMKNRRFAGMSTKEKLQILGYAHNQGVGSERRNNGAIGYLNSGRTGSDAWGTSGTAYFGPIGRRYDDAQRNAAVPAPASQPTPAKPGTELPEFHSGQAPFAGYKPSQANPYGALSPTAKAISDAMRPIPPAFTRVGLGAPGAAAASSIANDNRSTSSSHEVNVGKVEVHTQATDSREIAKSIGPAIERHSFATHANYGPA